jgi:hypothetical protein
VKRSSFQSFCLIFLLSATHFLTPQAARAQKTEHPLWSKEATPLDLSCANPPVRILSPDNHSFVEIACKLHEGDDPQYSMHISAEGKTYHAAFDEGARELAWSPDSKAFFINGNTSSYAGFFVATYRIDPTSGLHKIDVTKQAQRDMVSSFPPCEAFNRDAADCARIAANPEYNMSGIAWEHDSSAIDVFAEIPCSSSYGGIMCQVTGYELNVSDGRIIKRFMAKEVQIRWQKEMAWRMNIPDKPVYGPPQKTFAGNN